METSVYVSFSCIAFVAGLRTCKLIHLRWVAGKALLHSTDVKHRLTRKPDSFSTIADKNE